MQKITPFIWFDDTAEEAVEFYLSVFRDAKLIVKHKFGDEVPGPKGKAMVMTFQLEGQQFMALNGGPGVFELNGGISLLINCDTQEDVDYYWEKLSAVPEAEQCGWLKDKFGVTWQVVPTRIDELLAGPDPEGARRATQAMLRMKKLDIAELEKAYAGK